MRVALIISLILTVLFIIGIAGYRTSTAGEQAFIPWGMMVVGYVFFALASGGVFDSMAIRLYLIGDKKLEGEARIVSWSALALLVPGVILVFSDILHPLASYHFYTGFNPESRIAWNAVLYLIYGGALILYIVLVLRDGVYGRAKIVGLIALAASLLLEANLGMAYGVNIAVPAWYASMAPILFISASLALGSAFTIIIARLDSLGDHVGEGYSRELRYALVAFIFVVGWSLVSMASWGDARLVAEEILVGSVAPVFWVITVLLGVVTPVILSRRAPLPAALLAILGIAVFLSIPFNYTPQAVRLEANPLYNLLAEGAEYTPGIAGYLTTPETLAFIGGLGVWLLVQLVGRRVFEGILKQG
ncbi:MAG: polysulfide reductase NrfD [Desulfurococcales archaeon]|nr:polysulfide reductase NrfD [Desulfurococcales archaeon]